jgi:hypothetical protein
VSSAWTAPGRPALPDTASFGITVVATVKIGGVKAALLCGYQRWLVVCGGAAWSRARKVTV